MKPSEFDDFSTMLDVVAEQYGKRMSDGLKMLYWQGLVEYDLAAVREALSRHVRNPDTGQFIPKIADVVRMITGTTQDSALIAWAKVDKAVRHIGTGMTVVFDDPLIHRVLADMGGWVALGGKIDDEWPFVAKEFENRYRGYKMRNEIPEYLPRMMGTYESQNQNAGYESQPPVLIGNPDQAKHVLLGGSKNSVIGFTQMVVSQGRAA